MRTVSTVATVLLMACTAGQRPELASPGGANASETPADVRMIPTTETLLARLDKRADRRTLVFNASADRVLWIARDERREYVVSNGTPGPAYDVVQRGTLVVSPDGARVAYAAKRGRQWFAVVNGREQPTEGRPVDFVFSADGRRLAYGIRQGSDFVQVVDAERFGPFSFGHGGMVGYGINPGRLVFSPAGERFAFAAVVRSGGEKGPAMVLDGTAGAIYRKVGRPYFSPDGRNLAYWAARREARGLHLMVDGEPVDHSDDGSEESLLRLDAMMARDGLPFAPDREHLAYFTERSGRIAAVVHGAPGPPQRFIGRLVFSRDYSRYAYVAGNNRSGWLAISAVKVGVALATGFLAAPFLDLSPGLQRLVVLDGVARLDYPAPDESYLDKSIAVLVEPPVFSPDGTRLAYCSGSALVIDGTAGTRNGCRSILFSPDGRRTAHRSFRANRWHVAVDGRLYRSHSTFGYYGQYGIGWRETSTPHGNCGCTFTLDSQHFAYIAGDEGRFRVVVIPGGETAPYDHLPGAVSTDVAGRLAFIAIRGDGVLRVELQLPPTSPKEPPGPSDSAGDRR